MREGIASLLMAGGLISGFFGFITMSIGDKAMCFAGIFIGALAFFLGYGLMP